MDNVIKLVDLVKWAMNVFYGHIVLPCFRYLLTTCLAMEYFILRLRSPYVSDHILVEKNYQDQPILLIALYESGALRSDVKQFLCEARRAGLYIMGVNTCVLSEDQRDVFDTYIERPNIGRDFGSYKTGFLYLFNKKYLEQCPRLIMVNDSVFYESTRTMRFIEHMIQSEKEVLGATENFEVSPHLGSFCISMGGCVLNHPRFRQFWKAYKNSEVRPIVISRGEAALSACLRRCVSAPEEMGALYNLMYIDRILKNSPEHIQAALSLARRSQHVSWPNLIAADLWPAFMSAYFFGQSARFPAQCYRLDDAEQAINAALRRADPTLSIQLQQFVVARILDLFRVGSQIHNNQSFLMYLGLPIVKLDCIFRGVFIKEDIDIIERMMLPEEAKALRTLLMSKPYWGDSVKGWRQWWYLFGIQ